MAVLLKQGHSQSAVARLLGVNEGTMKRDNLDESGSPNPDRRKGVARPEVRDRRGDRGRSGYTGAFSALEERSCPAAT
jgi:hypothetical protein